MTLEQAIQAAPADPRNGLKSVVAELPADSPFFYLVEVRPDGKLLGTKMQGVPLPEGKGWLYHHHLPWPATTPAGLHWLPLHPTGTP